MKKTYFTVFTAVVLAACGGGNKENTEAKDSTATESTETAATAAENANILNPETDNLSAAIAVAMLNESMTCYYDKEMQFMVYALGYTDKEKFKQDTKFTASADASEAVMTVQFKTLPDKEFDNHAPFVIKGKISRLDYFGYLSVYDAEIVSEGKAASTVTFNPKAISADQLYNPEEIKNNILAWKDKEVTITGNYRGTTTSKSTEGKVLEIRADMTDPSGNLVVGCAFDEDPGDKLPAGATNVSISGKVDVELHYGNPYLTGCVVK